MSGIFVFLWMLFDHVLDDYVLQAPCLSNLKQKKWWKENAPDRQYRYDYLMALAMHSLSWAFMIMLPLAVYHSFEVDGFFLAVFFCNAFIHFFVDNEKANAGYLNLILDQVIHLLQIAWTYILLVL